MTFAGNLALSRALGDFVFKKNDKKRAEEQIVTGKSQNTGTRNYFLISMTGRINYLEK